MMPTLSEMAMTSPSLWVMRMTVMFFSFMMWADDAEELRRLLGG